MNVLAEFAPKDLDGAVLEHAVEEANREIIRAAHDGRGRDGMGTTMTACMLENERLLIAQVATRAPTCFTRGDSNNSRATTV